MYLVYSSFLRLFFNDTPTTEIYTLSLHDALPIFEPVSDLNTDLQEFRYFDGLPGDTVLESLSLEQLHRSEEHTSELQSRQYLVCRLLLEKKKKTIKNNI